MKVTIEDTNESTDNRQKSSAECENDNTELDKVLQLVVKCLLAHGYTREDIRDYFLHMGDEYRAAYEQEQKASEEQ